MELCQECYKNLSISCVFYFRNTGHLRTRMTNLWRLTSCLEPRFPDTLYDMEVGMALSRSRLPLMTVLDVSDSKIRSIEFLRNLPNLRVLNLSGTCTTRIGYLASVQHLRVLLMQNMALLPSTEIVRHLIADPITRVTEHLDIADNVLFNHHLMAMIDTRLAGIQISLSIYDDPDCRDMLRFLVRRHPDNEWNVTYYQHVRYTCASPKAFYSDSESDSD